MTSQETKMLRGKSATRTSYADHAPGPPLLDEVTADQRMGAVLRALRTQRQLSISVLARRSGLSVGMISQIERGLSTPSLRSLRLLAVSLDVPVAQFFEPETREVVVPSPYVVPYHARRRLNLNSTGVTKIALMPPGPGLLEMWEFCIAPGGSSGGDLYNHHGEKAGVVLSGRIRLWIEGQALALSEGDSFRFSSLLQHRVDNPYDVEARTIWIVTPPASGLRGNGGGMGG
ncbi:cupin domain-containing protein [Roseomonas sp. ACRSG]|nr:cupin domain-containing protein [Roseomonas sp. ACRSG]